MSERKTKVLIVDDELDVINSLKRFLTQRDFEILTACSGEEALEIIKSHEIDSVLLDIVMQGMHGDELAKIIKIKYPNIKIFIVTGHPEEGARITRNTEIEGFLLKPCSIQDIYSQLISMRMM